MDSNPALRTAVSRVLFAGVAASGLLIAGGLGAALLGMRWDAAGRRAILAGILILTATPVLRVAALAAGFALSREWRFFGSCVVLLALIALGIALG